MKESFRFNLTQFRLVQAMKNHTALPNGRAQTSGRARLVGSSHSVHHQGRGFFLSSCFDPSGIGFIPRLASVLVKVVTSCLWPCVSYLCSERVSERLSLLQTTDPSLASPQSTWGHPRLAGVHLRSLWPQKCQG